MRNVWVKTDVSTEAVSATEAKLFCKVTGSGDDTIFTMLIKQARENMEMYCGVSLAEKTLVCEWDRLPKNNIIDLPYGPVKSITSVTIVYEDTDTADEVLVANEDYYLSKMPWPQIRVATASASGRATLQVEYVVGYGATGCPPLPYQLKIAMLEEILTQYDNRENINVVNITSNLSNESKVIAAPYRRNLWFAPEA